MIFSANVSNLIGAQSPLVPAEHIINVATVDVPAIGNTPARYKIIFDILATANQPRQITWEYAASATRDTDYADVVAAVAVTI